MDEYIERRRLAKLGFTSPMGKLSVQKADAFMIIESELDRLRAEDARMKRKEG